MLKTLLLVTFMLSSVCVGKTLQINTSVPDNFLKTHQAYINFNAALAQLNIEAEFIYKPKKRAIFELNNGLGDGDLARTHIDLAKFPNIIKVPVPVGKTRISLYYSPKRLATTITKPSQLTNLHLGYVKGWVAYQNVALQGKRHSGVVDAASLLRILKSGRFDAVVLEHGLGEHINRKLNYLPDDYISSDVLISEPLYFFLHKKHQPLADKLAQAFTKNKV